MIRARPESSHLAERGLYEIDAVIGRGAQGGDGSVDRERRQPRGGATRATLTPAPESRRSGPKRNLRDGNLRDGMTHSTVV